MSTPDSNPASASEKSFIHFDNVCKQYGDLTVLDDLCIDIDAGEKVTLIGPSGSGKTTILRLLMTLETLTKGYIWVDGEPLWHQHKGDRLVPADQKHLREMRKQIGMVFQHFNLFPNMTVLENLIEAPVRSLGRPKEEAVARARELLDRVGLAEKESAHPNQLSGGQQQRVAIARALAMDPKVLLLDEVTSALDPELIAGVLAVLRELAETTDITMLIVTHEMHFARDVSDRVMMFDKGKIVEEGPPSQIFDAPEHRRTKDFLSAVLSAG
ncbi:MAG: ectoine/hydroxyectoine ABC transporter ATP-binding protein EhuA [Actinomycetota bacterium]|nr:ectoine/hydroxyectoine ABC transporter ATP-binding protein EhuA [Actinomycetota bacterium]